MGHKQFRQSTIHDLINQNFQMTWVEYTRVINSIVLGQSWPKAYLLLSFLLMLTAILSGCLGGEGSTERS